MLTHPTSLTFILLYPNPLLGTHTLGSNPPATVFLGGVARPLRPGFFLTGPLP